MYKTKALSEAGWLVNSNTDGFSYTMDRKKRFGTIGKSICQMFI